jgi:phospholipase C
MKFAAKSLLFLIALAATFAYAQNVANTPIKHVIVVIQENRTPDNLFQDSVLKANGADIVDPQTGGKCWTQKYGQKTVKLAALSLASCADPGHGHNSWANQYHNGAMDGACNYSTGCAVIPYGCPFDQSMDCGQYTYADNTVGGGPRSLFLYRRAVRLRELLLSNQPRAELPGASVPFFRKFSTRLPN